MANKTQLRTLGRWALGLLGLWLGLTWALPLVLPFLVGLLAAWLAEPLVQLIAKHTRLKRAWASVTVLVLFYALLGLGLWLGIRRVGYEVAALGTQLPAYFGALSRLQGALDRWTARAPAALGTALSAWVDSLFAGMQGALEQLGAKLLPLATALVGRLPGLLLGILTAVLSSFFISLELPELGRLAGRLPAKWARPAETVLRRIRQALGGWLRAQLRLMGVTFGIVTLGLTVLGVDVALVLGLFTAVVDALPVFGAGTILLPWALLCFLRQDLRLGIGLAVLYALAALTRQVLEPRLIGKQMGLSPLVTLFAMYVGYRLLGLAGMLGLPLGAMVARQFLPAPAAEDPEPAAPALSCFPARHGLE